MGKQKHTSGVWQFLELSGVLTTGSSEDIAQKRKEYWRNQKRIWKQERRKNETEFKICFTDTELKGIAKAASLHKMSRSRFIKQTALAYVGSGYVIPNIEELHKIKTALSLNYSALQEMVETDTVPYELGMELMQRIENLEQVVFEHLANSKSSGSDH